jgi:hypothetical protein
MPELGQLQKHYRSIVSAHCKHSIEELLPPMQQQQQCFVTIRPAWSVRSAFWDRHDEQTI